MIRPLSDRLGLYFSKCFEGVFIAPSEPVMAAFALVMEGPLFMVEDDVSFAVGACSLAAG